MSRPLRTTCAALLSLVLLPLGAGTALAAPAPDTAPTPTVAERKIEPRLQAQLDDGKAAFWVYLDSAADLTRAARASSKAAKGKAVYEAQRAHARSSQAGLLKALDDARAEYTSYWIVNAVRVVGTAKLAAAVAERSEVSRIDAGDTVAIPKPFKGERENTVQAVEWNVDRVKAPQVWDQFGVRGEGIVVANIDTGVDYLHPAVDEQYRGRSADGSYSHAYNWFDPAGVCSGTAPCDNNDHGTHTMGTMVGDDGGANKIGVAPGARWIAAKGCESNSCSQESLLASGQWILAPTDAAGQNPRPDLAPDIVNNSWGSTVHNPWYKGIVNSWRAAGIFPAFSNGNAGPACNTSGSPGDYVASYSSGAFDINNAIASFSSRGAGDEGGIKPNIAAPGANVRSAIRNGGYGSFSGTSMASPHTAAAVALIWAASPALQGDVVQTEALLDQSATDVNATTCGGTPADNNVFGEGRLDALAAVQAAPRGPVGALAGTVTTAGTPVAGAKVVADGPTARTTTTNAEGRYSFPALTAGSYAVAASKFGYTTASATGVPVAEGATRTEDFSLTASASATVSGTVLAGSRPVAQAAVTVADTPVTATTDAEGRFEVTLPLGDYTLRASSTHRCLTTGSAQVSVTGPVTATVTLPERTDTFGYACSASTTPGYTAGTRQLALTGDSVTESVRLPFSVPLYGRSYATAHVGTNGTVSFGGAHTSDTNVQIPSTGTPNAALYPFWDDLIVGGEGSGVHTGVTGTAPHRSFVIEWRHVAHWAAQNERFSFSILIGEDGRISYHYKDTTGTGLRAGSGATVGVENATGTDAFSYSFNSAALSDGLSLAFRTTRHGVVQGQVLDANDRKGVEGAEITVGTGTAAASAVTAADGSYTLQAPSGRQTVSVAAPAYQRAESAVDIGADTVVALTEALKTGKVAASRTAVDIVAPGDQRRTRVLELSNAGAATAYTVTEDAPWLTVGPLTGELTTGQKQPLTLSADTAGLTPGTVLTTDLRIASQSGRAPVVTVPVKVVVPRYQAALDTGASATTVDTLGDTWSPDRRYTAGSHGYQGTTTTKSTGRAITGTDDAGLYRTARQGMYEYRFDNVPNGVYTVELGFAEVGQARPNSRVFDVLAEGTEVLPSLDIALEAGSYAAVQRTYTVAVTDGTLNVRFVAHTGYGKPLVNALRVTERPDKG
ncbi:S8 family serine peptidase [Streptomyces yaizuensis]|uniref:S8 family serine peptidase n=1 Tax=Streptomyces yaizuensis TaxID=2989713 RepID=A0ABQ5P2Q5_9ACTN|nr:S8 family serine peptidase [Streptomyces sp. YSPA8]GLF96897.1 S8 family serine peptidase [Streptomyces sp. YSPA8]